MIPSHRSPAHFWQRIQSTGPAGFAPALLRRMALKMDQRYDFLRAELPVRIEDLVDSSGMRPPHPSRTPDVSLRIGWVCSPPGPGSGGHTTLFRMVEEAEQRGHECTLLLYDRNSDDVARHEPVIRRYWPNIRAGIRSATGAIGGMHALVASSWGTAHVVARRAPSTVNCFYFIQDYEPYFYPRGALYALAEDTYRFGFTNIALGEMVASRLQSELGITADATVPFGCDTSTYKLLRRDSAPRAGIVYYAKRSVDRRGYLLAKLALEIFHLQHPDQEIHIFGDTVSDWNIPVTNHGSLRPSELNALYNRTIASVALSFTNISLVAEELMAAGNVPVMNDHPFPRADLSTTAAIWVPATPAGIAHGLSEAVSAADIEGRARHLAESVRRTWRLPSVLVSQEIERICRTPANEFALPPTAEAAP